MLHSLNCVLRSLRYVSGLWAIVFLSLFACGDNITVVDPACEPTLGEAEVQLGVGEPNDFELITDGHELPLYALQGGQLFAVNLLLHGMVPGDPLDRKNECNTEIQFSVFNEAGTRIDSQIVERLGFEYTDAGHVLRRHVAVFLDGSREEIEALYGTTVRMKVDVSDFLGATTSDEAQIFVLEGVF